MPTKISKVFSEQTGHCFECINAKHKPARLEDLYPSKFGSATSIAARLFEQELHEFAVVECDAHFYETKVIIYFHGGVPTASPKARGQFKLPPKDHDGSRGLEQVL